MSHRIKEIDTPAACPGCGGPLAIREVECRACDIQIRGRFGGAARFENLTADQRRFLEAFLACRGVIRDVEAALSISYPTVKSRLESLLHHLGLDGRDRPGQPNAEPAAERAQILSDLDSGLIDPATAIERLNALKKS